MEDYNLALSKIYMVISCAKVSSSISIKKNKIKVFSFLMKSNTHRKNKQQNMLGSAIDFMKPMVKQLHARLAHWVPYVSE